jgi:hypothetical protein
MRGILAGTACCPRRTEELIWGTVAVLLIHLARLLSSGSPYPSPVYALNPPPVICRNGDSAEVCAAALQRLRDSGHHGLVATDNGRVESALCTAAWSCPAANANGGRSTGSGCSAKKHLPAVRRARLHQCCPAIRPRRAAMVL